MPPPICIYAPDPTPPTDSAVRVVLFPSSSLTSVFDEWQIVFDEWQKSFCPDQSVHAPRLGATRPRIDINNMKHMKHGLGAIDGPVRILFIQPAVIAPSNQQQEPHAPTADEYERASRPIEPVLVPRIESASVPAVRRRRPVMVCVLRSCMANATGESSASPLVMPSCATVYAPAASGRPSRDGRRGPFTAHRPT